MLGFSAPAHKASHTSTPATALTTTASRAAASATSCYQLMNDKHIAHDAHDITRARRGSPSIRLERATSSALIKAARQGAITTVTTRKSIDVDADSAFANRPRTPSLRRRHQRAAKRRKRGASVPTCQMRRVPPATLKMVISKIFDDTRRVRLQAAVSKVYLASVITTTYVRRHYARHYYTEILHTKLTHT